MLLNGSHGSMSVGGMAEPGDRGKCRLQVSEGPCVPVEGQPETGGPSPNTA